MSTYRYRDLAAGAAEFPHLAEHMEQHMTGGGLILDGLKRMRG